MIRRNTIVFLLVWLFVIHSGKTRSIAADKTCTFVCSNEVNPVCAQCQDELRTFSNPCLLRREYNCYETRCVIHRHGSCENHINFDCDASCPSSIEYFCGNDGSDYRTFSNRCQMEKQNKCAKQNYKFHSSGYCSRDNEEPA